MAGTVEATVKATVEIDSAQAKKAADDLANALIELKYEADKLNKESIISNEDIQRLDALKLKFSELSQSEQLAARDAELIYGHYTKLIDTFESLNFRNQVGQPGYLYETLFSKKEELKVDEEINAENKKRWELMEQIRNEYAEQVRLENQLKETTQDRIARQVRSGELKDVDVNFLDDVDIKDEVEKANIDYDQLANTLIRLTGASNGAGGSILTLGKALGAGSAVLAPFVIGIGGGIATIKKFKSELDNMLDTFDKVAKTIGTGTINGLDNFIDGLKTIADTVEQTIEKIDELSESGMDLERAFLTTSAYLGSDATNEIYDFMNSITGASNTMFKSINDVVAAAGSMGLASEDLVTATENMTVMGRNMGVLIGNTQKAFQDLGQVISKGYVGRDNLLYRIFTKEEINTVRQLSSEVERYNFVMERANRVQDLYNAYLQTSSGKVALMKMQYQEFMTNIGTVALQLYAMVAPILEKILALANGVLSAIISIFGWAPKTFGFESVSDKIAESMDKVGGAANKAKRQVASFDDVIQINDSKSGGGGAGGFDTEGLKDFSSILDDVLGKTDDLTDKWKKFKELLANKDFAGAGSEFARVIGDELWNINWNDIQTKAKDASSAISSFINGLVDISDSGVRDAWEGTGYTVAQVLNTIIGVVSQFLYQTHFGEIGKALGLAWQAMWASLNVEEAGQALYNGIMGVFDFVGGFLESGGLKQIALAAKKFIQSFFGSFDNIDIAIMTKTATDLVDDIINSIGIVAEALTSDDVKRVVFGLITKLVEAFKDKGPEWGKKLNVIVIDILNFISEAISTADKAGLVDAINQFMDALDLGTILSHFLTIAFQVLLHKAIIELNKFKAVGDAIGNIMYSAFLGVIGKILGLFTDLADKIRNIFSNLFNNPVFTTVLGVVTGSASASSGGLLNNIKNKFKVPRLATGGITTGSTIANIGEAGQEAILPLEGNTAWMDKLATKIAGQMGTTGAGGTVKVSLSDKPFYTKAEMYEFAELIVKSLKVYGLNVAIV